VRTKILCALFAVATAFVISGTRAQSPSPSAAVERQIPNPVNAPAASKTDSVQEAIKLLQGMKAANEEMLRKQQAALEALDELQKAADQIKIFSKRG
jgi:hypothetical protein